MSALVGIVGGHKIGCCAVSQRVWIICANLPTPQLRGHAPQISTSEVECLAWSDDHNLLGSSQHCYGIK